MISGSKFNASYARLHLGSQKTNGLCSNLFTKTDDHDVGRQLQFEKLIKELQGRVVTLSRKRNQQEVRMQVADRTRAM